jgi:hypothetical protein
LRSFRCSAPLLLLCARFARAAHTNLIASQENARLADQNRLLKAALRNAGIRGNIEDLQNNPKANAAAEGAFRRKKGLPGGAAAQDMHNNSVYVSPSGLRSGLMHRR